MALNVVMLGPPGAGKGTQSERFARECGVPKISTGEILREAVHDGTEIGRIVRAIMDEGKLVGDDVMIAIVRDRLDRTDACNGFVLDGFPRTVAQAIALDRMVEHRAPLVILDIVVPTEELVKRLATRRICEACGAAAAGLDGGAECGRCGGELVQRTDDSVGIVTERLKIYQRDTRPLVEFYRGRRTFRAMDGNQPADKVSADLRAAIEKITAGAWDRRPGAGFLRQPP